MRVEGKRGRRREDEKEGGFTGTREEASSEGRERRGRWSVD